MLVINSRSLLPAVGMVAGAVYSLHKRELSGEKGAARKSCKEKGVALIPPHGVFVFAI